MLPKQVRVFNKYVTNRVLRVFVSLSLGPFSVIRHVGRRTGKTYETVIWVWPTKEGFVIALTYGPEVDWRRNFVAAGGGTVLYHKKLYTVGKPEPVDSAQALQAFPGFLRFVFSTFVKQMEFVQLKKSDAEPAKA